MMIRSTTLFSLIKSRITGRAPETKWTTDEEGRENYTESIARHDTTELKETQHSFFNSLINVAETAVAGAAFYLYQKYDEEHETVDQIQSLLNLNNSTFDLSEATDIGKVGDHSIASGLLVCATALATLMAVSHVSNKYLFGDVSSASITKNSISNMSEEQITRAIEGIEDDPNNITDIKTKPSLNIIDIHKLQISYLAAGIITNLSGLPENQQYLLFSSTRCLVGSLLDLAQDKKQSQSKNEISLLPKNLINEFDADEKEKLAQALKSEIESKRDQNYYGEFTKEHLLSTAKVMAFFVALHNELASPHISSPFIAKSADFAVASMASNMINVIGKGLMDHYKIRSNETSERDIEMGPVNNSEIEDGVIPDRTSMTSQIKKSKSENDLPSTITKPSLARSLSENDLTNNPQL